MRNTKNMAEPSTAKKKKMDDSEWKVEDKEFSKYLRNQTMLGDLKNAIAQIRLGHSQSCVRLLKVITTNARACESFSRATCTTRSFPEGGSVVAYSLGSIFPNGLRVLERFVNEKQTPCDNGARKALMKLLQFMNTPVTSVKPPEKTVPECEWAVQLAQHLFSQLADASKFTLDYHYHDRHKFEETCSFGDTSFGCPDAWHGSVDIFFENELPIQVTKDEEGDVEDDSEDITTRERIPSDSSDYGNDSSVEVKSGEKAMDNSSQMLAQCIVFSFLQRKLNAKRMKHYLVPSFGVNTSSIIISFYDSVNDILLQTPEILLFYGDILIPKMIVCVWLAMNHRIFCSGITESMKEFKAEFHDQLGPDLKKYFDTVDKPMPNVKGSNQTTYDSNWSHKPQFRIEENPTMEDFHQIEEL